jgi:hypothetical protein
MKKSNIVFLHLAYWVIVLLHSAIGTFSSLALESNNFMLYLLSGLLINLGCFYYTYYVFLKTSCFGKGLRYLLGRVTIACIFFATIAVLLRVLFGETPSAFGDSDGLDVSRFVAVQWIFAYVFCLFQALSNSFFSILLGGFVMFFKERAKTT